jgi:hypothetical protein
MTEQRSKRRLAAILAADVVGYSRLMQVDEAGTVTALKTRRRDVLEPILAEHDGRIVKLMGDGVLVEFASAVDAVECAAQLQEGMAAANAGQPEERHIALRIGINLGDVIVDGSDLYGDGVNIAARLEAIAEPGSILILTRADSRSVSRARSHVPISFLTRLSSLSRSGLTSSRECARGGDGVGGGAVVPCAGGMVTSACPTLTVRPSFSSRPNSLSRISQATMTIATGHASDDTRSDTKVADREAQS